MYALEQDPVALQEVKEFQASLGLPLVLSYSASLYLGNPSLPQEDYHAQETEDDNQESTSGFNPNIG